jgi:hypothetical protein
MSAANEKDKIEKCHGACEYNDIVATRVECFSETIADSIRTGKSHVDKHILSQTDVVFMMGALVDYAKSLALISITPEKKKLYRRLQSRVIFNETLVSHGGVLSSAEAAEQLGISRVTVKKRKDTNTILALKIDGKFCYPVFQFTEEDNISDKGILKGVASLLPHLESFSDRMKFSFFMGKRQDPICGIALEDCSSGYTVASLLKLKPSETVMKEVFRLVRTFGTQGAV